MVDGGENGWFMYDRECVVDKSLDKRCCTVSTCDADDHIKRRLSCIYVCEWGTT